MIYSRWRSFAAMSTFEVRCTVELLRLFSQLHHIRYPFKTCNFSEFLSFLLSLFPCVSLCATTKRETNLRDLWHWQTLEDVRSALFAMIMGLATTWTSHTTAKLWNWFFEILADIFFYFLGLFSLISSRSPPLHTRRTLLLRFGADD